jgi:hypothetical protein
MTLFNHWYLHFSNVFYQYRKAGFFSSDKIKILFFSTSMSCYCTLQMCKNQLLDIVNFVSRATGCPSSGTRKIIRDYELLVLDVFMNNELQKEYDTPFLPAVVVLDKNNKVLFKIEYEEKMIEELKDLLTNFNLENRI